ncbi:MAG: enoyl-CoA hydratase/isomerase family protein [Oscillospiraceae bacterium]|nr:enoyl-CoA hydratase/isomerase family protein [Oscillospiraceae bacterium]
MSEARVIVERPEDQPGALYLTISNTDAANSFTVEMRQTILDAVLSVQDDPTCRVIVLRGDGDKFFSAGLSMEMLDDIKTSDDRIVQWQIGKKVRDALYASNKIIVAAVKGACAGAGFEFAMCCDLVYCADNAKFVLPEFNIGLVPGCGGAMTLHKHIPYHRFMELIFFCERMRAEEAQKWGFVNKIFPLADFDAEIKALVGQLCEKAPLAVQGLKEQLRIQRNFGDEAAYLKEYDLSMSLMDSNDFRGAVKAFRAKEKPVFNGN